MLKPNKTTSHLQQVRPAPIRKSGLHAIEGSLYGASTKQPLERAAEFDARMRAMGTTYNAQPIRNSTVNHKTSPYIATELAPSIRPGAMDAAALPSGGYVEQARREAQRRAALPFVPLRRKA